MYLFWVPVLLLGVLLSTALVPQVRWLPYWFALAGTVVCIGAIFVVDSGTVLVAIGYLVCALVAAYVTAVVRWRRVLPSGSFTAAEIRVAVLTKPSLLRRAYADRNE